MEIKISRRWSKLCEEVYRLYERKCSDFYDFSDRAKEMMFVYESLGKKAFRRIYNLDDIPKNNGFEQAKWAVDILISESLNEIKSREPGMPLVMLVGDMYTLNYDGTRLPKWFVDSKISDEIFEQVYGGKETVMAWVEMTDRLTINFLKEMNYGNTGRATTTTSEQ